jgi:basic membrane protein A
MYGAGADVIYHAAGGSGGGLFEAAKEASESGGSQMWAIGVDSDQYNIVDASLKPYILTSMLKKVDVAVYDTISRHNDGDEVGGVVTTYDLEAGGVDYATSGGFVDDIADQLEELKAQIIAGDIEVPTAP